MTCSRAPIVFAAMIAAAVASAPLVSLAGEVVKGPVHVCRKPMLAGTAAFTSLVNPGPDAWRKLAERQADEAKYCYMAGDVELVEKGTEMDVGQGTRCTEWRAKAKGDPVYVVIGSRDRTWGRCP